MAKERLDCVLIQRNFFTSREKARAEIMAGNIFVNGNREDKSGTKVDPDAFIELKAPVCPYVSRGGLKLMRAIDTFHLTLANKKSMDVGASTGGFTDCMLKNGAESVIAIDVGYGQLAWELRENRKVHVLERTNIKHITPDSLSYRPDFVTVDVSFISLKKVLAAIINVCEKNAELICLIKPQFEAGREKVGKKGVVREKETHQEVLISIVDFFQKSQVEVLGLTYSPIKGPEGNIEFLLYGKILGEPVKNAFKVEDIEQLVQEAHEVL